MTITEEIKSHVYYLDPKTKDSICLLSCSKDNIDESFSTLNLPDTCAYYVSATKAALKALAMYDLGAVVEIYREPDNSVRTKALELINFNAKNEELTTLSVPRSVIAIMSLYINKVDYSCLADVNKNYIHVLEKSTYNNCLKELIRYTSKTDEDELDVTFLYAVASNDNGFYYIESTYDMSSNSFKNTQNECVQTFFNTNVKDDYEELFKQRRK